MDISFFISELLYDNDCVIIPGFGGFVAHYTPASIHPISHSFHPPSKSILFNSKLIRDDGLLIDFISEKQHIPYSEAKTLVEEFTGETLEKLALGELSRFKNIGNLQRDQEGKLLFSPDDSVNYLEEAFGLPIFISPPILRKSVQQRLETKFIDRKPVPGRERSIRKMAWVYVAVIPVLFILAWFIYSGNFKPQHTQQTGIVDLSDSDLKYDRETKVPIILKNEANPPPLESLDFSDTSPVESEINEETSESIPKNPIIRKKYYIIGGAFGVELNADKLVAVLRNKGYEAQRSGLSKSGLHMVSYFSTKDKSEALVNLDIIRKEDNPSAWLLRK